MFENGSHNCYMYDVRIVKEGNRISKKVGSSSEFLQVARPKFTLNLQHLKGIREERHFGCKSQIRNVSTVQR